MVSSKRLIIVLSFMLLALLLSACVSSGEVAPEAEFGVSLPRIVVEIDDNGVACSIDNLCGHRPFRIGCVGAFH